MTTKTYHSELQDCPVCANYYLFTRTDLYKDGRPFVYCDCCGMMAPRQAWNRIEPFPDRKYAES